MIPIDVRGQSDVLRSEYFPAALASTAFMHSLLCSTALHRYVLGKGSYESVIYHRQCTVSEINASLNDSELSIADGTLAAVFFLVCVEESMILPSLKSIRGKDAADEPDEKLIHLNGLKRMIELRGGLKALTSARFVRSMILWLVLTTAHMARGFAD